ncbi:hypothetical protein O3P69_008433 [Scylla paramamosain]|uniref:PH domain-containing protein n=1 Tax=Scylla paramamosain TaxID=85552 RepID=A0AAW0SND3_SCYPA
MDSPYQHRALLLGLVEVTGSVTPLDEEARARVFAMCHAASIEGRVEDPSWVGRLERGLMGVEVIMDQKYLHITSNEVLVSRHSLEEGCVTMAMRGAEGHLVLIGRCQVKGVRLAVVLDMMSGEDAQQLQEEVSQRLSHLGSLLPDPSAPQNTAHTRLMSRPSPFTAASNVQRGPATSNTQHSNRTAAHNSASLLGPETPPPPVVAQPASRPPPISAKPVFHRRSAAVAPVSERSPLVRMPTTGKLITTPLCLISRSPVSLVATKPMFILNTSPSSVTAPPTVTSASIPSPLVSTPMVLPRPTSIPKVFTSRFSTPTVSTPIVSTQALSTVTMSAPPVSTATVSPRPVSIPKVFLSQLSTPVVSTPTASTVTVSTQSVSTVTMSNRTVPTSKVSIRPLPFPKTFTPLASLPSAPISKASTRPVITPKVSIRPVTIPKVFTPLASIAAESNTLVSTSAVSAAVLSSPPTVATTASTSTTSTSLAATSRVTITLVSTTVVASKPVSVCASRPSVSNIMPSSVRDRRPSIASLASQDEESHNNEKIELLLGALKVEESEYLYIPGMEPPQEQDSSKNLEQELTSLLENERQYLDTLQRIIEARETLTSELKDLLRGCDRLFKFHDELYQNLCQEFSSSSGIVQVFLSHKEEFDQYRYCIMNAPQVVSQLQQQTEEIVKQHPTLEADIKSLWKRIHFYFMTFERLAKIVPVEEQGLAQKVVDLLRETNRQGDSGILIDSVSGAPFSLHTLGTLVLHSLFTIKDPSGMLGNKTKYHVLLFEEMIVILLPKKEKYQYKDHFPLRQLNLLTQSDNDKETFVLELIQGGNKKNRKYTFRPRHPEAKAAWVAEISRLLLKFESEVERLRKLRSGYH